MFEGTRQNLDRPNGGPSGNNYKYLKIDDFVDKKDEPELYVTSVLLTNTNISHEVKRIREEEKLETVLGNGNRNRIDIARLIYLVIKFQGIYTYSTKRDTETGECKIVQLLAPKDDGRSSSLLENLSSMFLWFN